MLDQVALPVHAVAGAGGQHDLAGAGAGGTGASGDGGVGAGAATASSLRVDLLVQVLDIVFDDAGNYVLLSVTDGTTPAPNTPRHTGWV